MHLRYLGCNTQFAREIGLQNPKDVIGKTDEQLVKNQPNIKRYQQGDLKTLTEGMALCNMESRYVRQDGAERILLTSKIPLTNTQNQMIGVLGIHTDITERKQYEATLEASGKILNDTGRMAKIGGWEHDLATGKAVWTQALYDIVEIDSGDPPGVNEHLDYYPPQSRSILKKAIHEARENGVPFDLELQVFTAKKKQLWCRATGEPIFQDGRCVKLRGTFQDITAQKEMEKQLADSEAMFRGFVENADDIIYALSLDGTLCYVSPNSRKLVGYDPQELLGKPYAAVTHPDDMAMCNDVFHALISQGGTHEGLEHRIRHKDGHFLWSMSNLSVITNEQGHITACLGISRNIHERKQIEKKLKASEMRLRELIDHMDSGVIVYEPTPDGMDFVFKECNDATLRIEHITKEDFIGKRVTEVFPGVEDFGLLAILKKVNETGIAEEVPARHYEDYRISGWRENYVYKVPSGEIVVIYDDITDKKKAEKEKNGTSAAAAAGSENGSDRYTGRRDRA